MTLDKVVELTSGGDPVAADIAFRLVPDPREVHAALQVRVSVCVTERQSECVRERESLRQPTTSPPSAAATAASNMRTVAFAIPHHPCRGFWRTSTRPPALYSPLKEPRA